MRRVIGMLLAVIAMLVVAAPAADSAAPLPPLPLIPGPAPEEPPEDPPEEPEPPSPPPPDEPTGPVLHLTFDDGPDPRWTPQILDVLARRDARATFFLVGERADAYPELVRRIVDAGHTVANHTYTHVDLRTVSEERLRDEVDRTQRAIGPDARPCLRPPYGGTNQRVRDWTAAAGYRHQLWDVDPQDYTRPGAGAIADRIVAGARDGAVVLLHDAGGRDRSETVQGLAIALDRLAPGDWRYEHTC